MYIETRHVEDTVHEKANSGAYEWWYFDALDENAAYGLVVIFYEGNPFSPRYNRQWQEGKNVAASAYPAVSISIYYYGKPVYYSFTEYDPGDSYFSASPFEIKIGDHRLVKVVEGNQLRYELQLSEYLPSGDALTAALTYVSALPDERLGRQMNMDQEGSGAAGQQSHSWLLMQPAARVSGSLTLYQNNTQTGIDFKGEGYHDHNIGYAPMHKEFDHWYWGRLHTADHTLIYYVMDKGDDLDSRAWLINKDSSPAKRVELAESVSLEDFQWSLFGLKSARRVKLDFRDVSATLRLHTLVDNGPFYQRFISEGVIHSDNNQKIERRAGMGEYIEPARIQWRLFWPLIRMRLRYGRLASHPVQKSPRLYRWTW